MKVHIAEEIQLSKENEFSKCLIESKNIVHFLMQINFHIEAIQRYFESRRRNWRESNSSDQGKIMAQSKKRRVRARMERVCFTFY